MKQKTVKGTSKRFTKTGRGKIMRRKMSAQHLAFGKSKRTLKKSKQTKEISPADSKKIKKMIPYK